MNSHLVIGTAGHVDHGKTALIRHLTGIETDRLADEKLRGITIENGYAHLELNSGAIVGFIDVPGHERFIKTMLAGSMGIDAVMLIVAADEGVKPQTLEHLHILNHLKIHRGLLVITKSDLVSEFDLTVLEGEIRELIAKTSMNGFEIIRYSIYDEACRTRLIKLLESIADYSDEKLAHAASRMSIDRVFTVKGVGTVVTGTLVEGSITRGESLYLYPSEKKIRIKGIQVYGKSVDKAEYGQRVALNVSIDHDEIARGDLITSIHPFPPTMIVEAQITVDDLEQDIKHWQRLKLYHGTREILCRIALGIDQRIGSGDSKRVQLRLETPIYCKANDPLILRSYSPMLTLGGGIILTAHAEKRIADPNEESAFDDLIELKTTLKSAGMIFSLNNQLFERSSLTLDTGYALFKKMLENGTIIDLGENCFILDEHWRMISDHVIDALTIEHKMYPLRNGMQRETLRSKLGSVHSLTKHDFIKIVDRMLKEKTIKVVSGSMALFDYTPELSSVQYEASRKIMALVDGHHQSLVPISDLTTLKIDKNVIRDVLYHLINYEFLVKINDETIMNMVLYKTFREKMLEHFIEHDVLSVAEFRDMTGMSRKSTVMLLEHFDRIKLTKRNENSRTLIKN